MTRDYLYDLRRKLFDTYASSSGIVSLMGSVYEIVNFELVKSRLLSAFHKIIHLTSTLKYFVLRRSNLLCRHHSRSLTRLTILAGSAFDAGF